MLAEIAKALSGKHEVTILTTDTCTDLSMYGYAESTVLFDYFSYSASSFIERLLCKGYSFLYKHGLHHIAGHLFSLPMSVYKKKGKNWQHTMLKSAGYEAVHVYIRNYSLYITNVQ